MYIATGYGLIQCVKGLMSYADEVRHCLLHIPIFAEERMDAGPPRSAGAHETGRADCFPAQEEGAVPRIAASGIRVRGIASLNFRHDLNAAVAN